MNHIWKQIHLVLIFLDGFRKVTNIEQGLKTEKDDLEFQHPYFQKEQEHLLEHIKRKITHVNLILCYIFLKSCIYFWYKFACLTLYICRKCMYSVIEGVIWKNKLWTLLMKMFLLLWNSELINLSLKEVS